MWMIKLTSFGGKKGREQDVVDGVVRVYSSIRTYVQNSDTLVH